MFRFILHMYLLTLFFHKTVSLLVLLEPTSHQNLSARTGPQDLLVTSYDCEENQKKTLQKYATNQVTQCESEPQNIESTKIVATLYLKARATTLTGYKFTAKFSEKKVDCSQVSNGSKNRLDNESLYQINMERFLHLNPKHCKKEIQRLKISPKKATNRKLLNFEILPESAHQAELEGYHGHIKLDDK